MLINNKKEIMNVKLRKDIWLPDRKFNLNDFVTQPPVKYNEIK